MNKLLTIPATFENEQGELRITGTKVGDKFLLDVKAQDGETKITDGANSATITNVAGKNSLDVNVTNITITNAQLDQIVAMVVNAGLSLTKVQAILSGAANGTMSASGSITVTNAQCGAIIDLLAQGNCSMTPNMFLSALASLECDIGGPTPLSPEGLAKAVWDENIADHLSAGSTGKALSDAGAAGNPWSTPLSGNNTPGTFGNLVQKLLTVAKFLGLK